MEVERRCYGGTTEISARQSGQDGKRATPGWAFGPVFGCYYVCLNLPPPSFRRLENPVQTQNCEIESESAWVPMQKLTCLRAAAGVKRELGTSCLTGITQRQAALSFSLATT